MYDTCTKSVCLKESDCWFEPILATCTTHVQNIMCLKESDCWFEPILEFTCIEEIKRDMHGRGEGECNIENVGLAWGRGYLERILK